MWSAKEKASVEAIKEKANVYNDEITSLSNELERVSFECCLNLVKVFNYVFQVNLKSKWPWFIHVFFSFESDLILNLFCS